jgi:hypothetical protein
MRPKTKRSGSKAKRRLAETGKRERDNRDRRSNYKPDDGIERNPVVMLKQMADKPR